MKEDFQRFWEYTYPACAGKFLDSWCTRAMLSAVSKLQAVMDRRIAFRLSIIALGRLLSDNCRTASAWFATAEVKDDWDRFYDCLGSIGRTSGKIAAAVVGLIVEKFAPEGRIMQAIDDSPTSRYGSHVEGVGVHHNLTPGPADGEWLYGHHWGTLACLTETPKRLPTRSTCNVLQISSRK